MKCSVLSFKWGVQGVECKVRSVEWSVEGGV